MGKWDVIAEVEAADMKASSVYGRYDIVTFVEAPDFSSVNKISEKINAIKGIKSTETAIEG